MALFFLVIGEFCLQGFDFVEYLLVLDVPACNGSFNSHGRWFFLFVPHGMEPWHSHGDIPCGTYILAGGGAVDQSVERVDKIFILVWLDHVGIGA